jgi:DnaJ-class molecular chaperone
MEKTVCPRCLGNGYIKVKESIENPTETIHQCPQCNSQGEIMMDETRLKTIFDEHREKYRYKDKLTVEHVQHLEKQIENLMKDKAVLQDQLDKYIDKEMEKR